MKIVTDIFNYGEVIEEGPGRIRYCECVFKAEFGGRRPNQQCKNIIIDFNESKMFIYSSGRHHQEYDIKLVPIRKRDLSGRREETTTWSEWE